MKQLFLALLLFAQVVRFAPAQAIDPHEILRRGNHVEVINAAAPHTDGAAEETAELAALAPPADDSHKWFISIITLDNCGPCKKLLADWPASPELAAFAQPRDAKSSWAHLNIYAAEDETQTWRWQHIAVKSYPTILLQPPRSGLFGDPAVVVLQKSGYHGKPAELAAQLRAAVQKHVKQHRSESAQRQNPGVHPRGTLAEEGEQTTFVNFEQKSPPFAPPVKPSVLPLPTFDPLPLLPAIPPSVDPDAKPVPVEPSEPAPAPDVLPAPANEKYPQHPEAVVIVDKQSESFSDLAVRAQVRRVLDRLLAERPGLIVRMLDVRDARQYPVAPRELPAVLTTSEGRLETKIDRTLLPVVAAEPPPFPWQAVAGLLANGFNWAGAAALLIWGVARFRAYRQARGEKLLVSDELVQQVRTLVEELLKKKTSA
jgi:thiol-disulfide isomerase/thioredoxin